MILNEPSNPILTFGSQNQFTLSIANDQSTREEAYHFLYQNYLEKGLVQRSKEELCFSIYDAHPETVTLIVRVQGYIVGTLSIAYDSPWGLPCLPHYNDSISQLRRQGRRPAEVISLAIKKDLPESTAALLKLFNVSYVISKNLRRATDYVITVQPRHASYYQRKLLFERFGETRPHSKVGHTPAKLLRLDLDLPSPIIRSRPNLSAQSTDNLYPRFFSDETEQALRPILASSLKEMSRNEIEYFFGRNRAAFTTAPQDKPTCLPENTLRFPFRHEYSLAS